MTQSTHRYTPIELEKIWQSLGVVDALGQTVGLTILPTEAMPARSVDQHLQTLGASDVELIEPIAEGGMAQVHLGRQRGLEREVAVKRLKPAVDGATSRARLLREAQLTGGLEHPNIIPVHTLGVAEDGGPLLVMKHIDGITWRDYIDAPDTRADALSGDTPFEKNLDVLMQVAKAVHYAHRQGIVHRDIKPENIMIGRFGDVYLLDWGIAVGLGPADGVRPRGVAGTPGYMAPEMVGTADMHISQQTDVFLMGAVLHELITGEPPHAADSVHKAMHKAYQATPQTYSPSVPIDLASICWRAMARDPAERFASAEAFRLALVQHLKNRASAAIAEEAERRLAQMQSAAQAVDADHAKVYRYYGAARFGFEQALRQWPENQPARRGLQHTLEGMIDFALEQDQPETAAALAAELPDTNTVLEERLAAGFQRQTAQSMELAALRALEHDIDPEVGARTRSRVALALGAVLGALAMGAGAFARKFLPDGVQPMHYLPHGALLFLITAGFLFANRRVLLQNRLNRRISQMTLLMMGGGFLFRIMVVLENQPVMPMLPLEFVLYAVCIAMMGFATHRRLALASLPALLGAGAMVLSPQLDFEIAGITVFAALASMAAVWRGDVSDPLAPPPPAPVAPRPPLRPTGGYSITRPPGATLHQTAIRAAITPPDADQHES